MRFVPTTIEGAVIVELDVQADNRGSFARTFCETEFAAAGLPFRLVQANLSSNTTLHTLRGMHWQEAPHGEPKVVWCIRGRIHDVAVDMREGSPSYLDHISVELSPGSNRMLYLAPGLAHGFLTLEPNSDVHYFMGATYVPHAARGLRWSDPSLAIQWPAAPAVISEKDGSYPLLPPSGEKP